MEMDWAFFLEIYGVGDWIPVERLLTSTLEAKLLFQDNLVSKQLYLSCMFETNRPYQNDRNDRGIISGKQASNKTNPPPNGACVNQITI